MNKIYRIVWNDVRQAYVVAAEHAAARGKPASTVKRVASILASALIAQAACAAPAPNALPTGGQVVAGQAAITQSGNAMTVQQTSNQAILNWQSFNIGANASVNFQQPSANAVALNRVIGADPSAIYGSLTANGQVYLINPNGVLFAQGASVNVGGLVASTLNIKNEDFLAGNNRFTRDGATGSVVNQGTIDAKYVALLAPEVRNEGVIMAQMGTVALAAGEAVTLSLTGNQLIGVQVDKASINTLVENRHLVQADGGTVIMSAQSANQLLGQVVNSGVIEARGISSDGGTVRLLASSTIDHSGSINVDGAANGKGGSVTLLADLSNPGSHTTVSGSISAQGGSVSGDGGFIETSGHSLKIADTASISTKAFNGKTGTWLLDPYDFTVSPAGGDISGAALGTALDTNDVTIQTTFGGATCDAGGSSCGSGASGSNGDIIINDTVTWQTGTALYLNAYRNIQFGSSAALTFGSDAMAFPNGASIHITYGTGGSGYAYAVNGSSFSGGGQIIDSRNASAVTDPATTVSNAGGLDYIIGTVNAPINVQMTSGGSSTYGDVLSPVYLLNTGTTLAPIWTAVNINAPSGTPTWSWTGGTFAASSSTKLNAGSYTGLAYSSGLTSNFYSSFATGATANWTVNQRPITLTASNQSKTYGQALTLDTTAFTLSAGTMGYTDSITNVALASASSYASTAGTAANTYAGNINITGETGAGGFLPANYAITTVAGDLTVNQRPVSITVSKPFDHTTTFTSGFVAGNLYGSDTVTVSGTADVSGTAAGTYTSFASQSLTLSQTGSNYTLTGGAVAATIESPPATDPTVTNWLFALETAWAQKSSENGLSYSSSEAEAAKKYVASNVVPDVSNILADLQAYINLLMPREGDGGFYDEQVEAVRQEFARLSMELMISMQLDSSMADQVIDALVKSIEK